MPYRLAIRDGDRTTRHLLADGEAVVGSIADADIRIPHPSISRRHARISLRDGELSVEDLDSRNGTRVGDARVRERTQLVVGARLTLGTVEAVVEEVSGDDLAAGISIATPDPTVPAEAPTLDPATTAESTVLEAFALKSLPSILESLAAGASFQEAAANVGDMLHRVLPVQRVQIARGRGGLLFTAGTEQAKGSGTTIVAVAGGSFTIDVSFLNERLARSYGAIVESAASVLKIADDRSRGTRSPAPDTVAPPLPQPPTVDPAVREIFATAARIAPSEIGVLIRGESGTGKEVLARYVHEASHRGALVALNCAALPRDLLEAELFGVEKGAATGVSSRPGKFEQADEGTLFLDEIGDMAPETQAKILRVLQEGVVYRLGAGAARPARARVIAATNRDLDEMLEDGGFRSDLYHRFADWVVELPPLRERRGDIPNLAAHFLAQACESRGVRCEGISRGAIDVLSAYSWPGNVRQLEREMARAALFVEDGALLERAQLQAAIVDGSGEPSERGLRDTLERVERAEIKKALDANGGDVQVAARSLELPRSSLYRRMQVLGIKAHDEADG